MHGMRKVEYENEKRFKEIKKLFPNYKEIAYDNLKKRMIESSKCGQNIVYFDHVILSSSSSLYVHDKELASYYQNQFYSEFSNPNIWFKINNSKIKYDQYNFKHENNKINCFFTKLMINVNNYRMAILTELKSLIEESNNIDKNIIKINLSDKLLGFHVSAVKDEFDFYKKRLEEIPVQPHDPFKIYKYNIVRSNKFRIFDTGKYELIIKKK